MKKIGLLGIVFISIFCQCFIINCVFAEDSKKGDAMENDEKKLPIDGEVFTVKDNECFLIMPDEKTSGKKIPWVWYAPTLPGLPGVEEKWMFEHFLGAGIAIAGMDVGESFGNPESRALFSAFHDELAKNRGLSKKPCLLVRSRGGLMLYNWAAEHPESVTCIAGIYPVCNLNSYPGIKIASQAYGMTEDQLNANLKEHNPIDRLKGLAENRVPIFHIHGDSDTVVPLEDNSGEVQKRYNKFGGKMTLVVPKEQGHNMWVGFFQCQELVDFVIAHAKSKE